MSETRRPKNFQVNAARGIAEINQRLGDKTPDWILKLAAIRLPFDPPDQETWRPPASRRKASRG